MEKHVKGREMCTPLVNWYAVDTSWYGFFLADHIGSPSIVLKSIYQVWKILLNTNAMYSNKNANLDVPIQITA